MSKMKKTVFGAACLVAGALVAGELKTLEYVEADGLSGPVILESGRGERI